MMASANSGTLAFERIDKLQKSRPIFYLALAIFAGWTVFVYGKFYRQINFEWKYLAAGIAAILFGATFLPEKAKALSKVILAWAAMLGVLVVLLAALAAAPRAVMVFVGLALAAWRLGSAIIRWSGLGESLVTGERLVFGLAFGWAGISLGAAALGAVSLLRFEVFLPLFLLGVAWALWGLREVAVVRQYQTCQRRLVELDGTGWLTLGCLAILLLHALVLNLAPSTLSDDLIYHRAIAKIFVRQGGIGFVPFYSHFNMPFGQEMLYATALVLKGGDQAVGLVNLGYDVLLIGAFLVIGRELGSYIIGAAASLMLFSVPWWIIHLSAGSTDLKFLTFTLLALHAFLRWRATGDNRFLALCGVCVGCSFHYRYQGLILGGFFLLAAAAHLRFGREARPASLRQLSHYVFGAVLLGSPWLLRNCLNTGNPFFPTSPPGIDGFFGDAELSEVWRSFGDPNSPWFYATFGYGASLKSLITLPWQLTFAGWAFEGYELTPILFAACPLVLVLLWRQTPAVRLCAAFAAVYTLAWFSEVQIVKFLIPAFAVLALVSTTIFFRASAPQSLGRSLLLSLFVFLPLARSLTYMVVDAKERWRSALRVVSHEQSREDYIVGKMPDQEVIFFANRHLPDKAVVFSVNEIQLYNLDREYIYGHPTSQLQVDYRRMPRPQDLLARLRQLHVTHVLCHTPFKPDISQLLSSADAAQALVFRELDSDSACLRKIHEAHGLALFEVLYPPDLPAYTGTAVMDPARCGDFLLEYGMLERARTQFAKAGASGAAQLAQLDRMTPLERARFYVGKARQLKWAYFIKPALDEYALALKRAPAPTDPNAIRREMKEARDLACGLAPHTWGRALD